MVVNTYRIRFYTLLIFFVAAATIVQAQTKTIAIVKDNELTFTNELETKLKEEINTLLQSKYEVNYTTFSANNDAKVVQQSFDKVYADRKIDLVIAIGIMSSKIMHAKMEYQIPSISTMIIEEKSGAKLGVDNYTYFNLLNTIEEGIKYFASLYQLKTIGVLVEEPTLLNNLISSNESEFSIESVKNADALKENIEGLVFFGPMFHTENMVQATISEANEQGIPTFSLYRQYLSYGCTASLENVFTPFLKKTAIQSLHFFDKQGVSELGTQEMLQFRPVLNMESIRAIQKLPEWEYFEDAIVINISKSNGENLLSLSSAIAIGLEEKISIKTKELAQQKANQDLQQAKGNLGPKLSLGAQATWLSNNLVEASLGQKGELTIAGSLNLQQVLFSESVLANVAIKKLLLESATVESKQELLDAVVSISHAYVSVLLAQSNLILQNENLNKSKLGLSIAKNKKSLGVSKTSDVNRWVSELNKNRMQLSTAEANYKKSIYSLNEVLNQPISSNYKFPFEFSAEEQFKFPKELISPYLKNEFLTESLADFYLQETKSTAPEFQRLLLSEQIIERKLKSAQRQLFMPELVGFVNASDIWLLDGVQANPQLPVPPPPQDLTWNAGLGIRVPVFNNRIRKTSLEKANLDKEMVAFSALELSNAFEKNIRSQTQELRSLFISSDYAQKAAVAANDNFIEMENAYQAGFINIDQLIEAQTIKFTSDLLVKKTNYEIALSYLKLERLTGTIQILKPESEQKAYLTRLEHHLLKAK